LIDLAQRERAFVWHMHVMPADGRSIVKEQIECAVFGGKWDGRSLTIPIRFYDGILVIMRLARLSLNTAAQERSDLDSEYCRASLPKWGEVRIDLSFAGGAGMNPPAAVPLRSLKDKFLALLIAGCTYPMRWFGAACVRFQHIGKGPGCNLFELVPLLLSFPCFKASNFFFKIAYRLNQRRLFRLRVQQGFLYGEELLLELDGCFEKLSGIPQTHYGLGNVRKRLDRIESLADSYQIRH
jgi:hypothetical protein